MKTQKFIFTFAIFALLLTACGVGPVSAPVVSAPAGPVQVIEAPVQAPQPDTVPLEATQSTSAATQPSVNGQKSGECQKALAELVEETIGGSVKFPIKLSWKYHIQGYPAMESLLAQVKACGYTVTQEGDVITISE